MPKKKDPDLQVIFSNFVDAKGRTKTLVNFTQKDGGVQLIVLDEVNATKLYEHLNTSLAEKEGIRSVHLPTR